MVVAFVSQKQRLLGSLGLGVVTSEPVVGLPSWQKIVAFCRLQVVMRRAQDAASAIDFGNAVTWVCTCCALDAIEAILLDQYYESFVRGFHSDLLLELLGEFLFQSFVAYQPIFQAVPAKGSPSQRVQKMQHT